MQLQPYDSEDDDNAPDSPGMARWEDTASHARALLGTWLIGNDAAAGPNGAGGAASGGKIELREGCWRQVPMLERADCQILCTHPAVLEVSRVKMVAQDEGCADSVSSMSCIARPHVARAATGRLAASDGTWRRYEGIMLCRRRVSNTCVCLINML
jgi:hypothetical protein